MPAPISLPRSLDPPPFAGAPGALVARPPSCMSFAVTSMTVPDGSDALRPVSRTTRPRVGRRNRRRIPSRRPRAIVLDADPAILDVLGQLLHEENYEVTLSTRFIDREDVTPLHPDVIVTDAAFNQGPAGECLYPEPLQRPDGTTIPIVYSTTVPDVAARLSAMTVPILLKPFDLDTLLALLRRGHS